MAWIGWFVFELLNPMVIKRKFLVFGREDSGFDSPHVRSNFPPSSSLLAISVLFHVYRERKVEDGNDIRLIRSFAFWMQTLSGPPLIGQAIWGWLAFKNHLACILLARLSIQPHLHQWRFLRLSYRCIPNSKSFSCQIFVFVQSSKPSSFSSVNSVALTVWAVDGIISSLCLSFNCPSPLNTCSGRSMRAT